MKVSLNLNREHAGFGSDKVSFKGYKPVVNEYGFKEFEFSYPFDEEKQNCYLEIFSVNTDPYGNYKVNKMVKNRDGAERIKLNSGSNVVNLTKMYGIDAQTPFAYHYIVEDKWNTSNFRPKIDAGTSIDERPKDHDEIDSRIYNVVHPTQSDVSRGGAMKLVIPDSQNVGVLYKQDGGYTLDHQKRADGEGVVKTLWNKLGGNLAGIEKDVEEGRYDAYSRIISLPIFGRDSLSAHGYWSEELYQMAPGVGNVNNYSSLQKKLFAHGINWVSDGAFVNEGLQGVHFQHVLKWGEDSPFYNWFNGQSLDGKTWNLGIFPKDSKNMSHKLVNPPILYTQNSSGEITRKRNHKYDPKKPTYIQYFDKTLVNSDEIKDTQHLIKSYSKQPENIYSLNTHNDSMYPYHFQINPKEYDKNIKRLEEYNNNHPSADMIKLSSYEGTKILSKFSTWTADGMFEGGFETWDANPDIPKLKFTFSNQDYKRLKNFEPVDRNKEVEKILLGNAQVRDYTVEAGKYWTKKTSDIHRLYIAQNLKNINSSHIDNPSYVYTQIAKLADNKVFPVSLKAEITQDEIENVLQDFYNNRPLPEGNKQEQVLREIMNFPLESIEFGSNILSVLSSPYISKRASNLDEVGVPRYELYKQGTPNLPEKYRATYNKTEKMLDNQVYPYVMNVLEDVDSKLPKDKKLFNGDEVTEYGKYTLPLVVPTITKYVLVKSLIPDLHAKTDDNTGEISYDYDKMSDVHLQSLGIKNPVSVEDEANDLLEVMSSGISKLSSKSYDEIESSLLKTLGNSTLQGFQLADLIINKTQSGLDWRIDATKDVADIESLRNHNASFEDVWQEVTDFWRAFVDGVLSENPNSYIVAEVTDEGSLHRSNFSNKYAKYPSTSDINQKFLRETGINSTANYTYLFNDLAKMFSKSAEDASYTDENMITDRIMDILIKRSEPFLKSGPLESILYSYTFVGNHDKPRILHCAAMDMNLFYTDLNDINNREYRRIAYMIMNNKYLDQISDGEIDSYDYSKVSPKAVAAGISIYKAAMDVLNNEYSNKLSNSEFKKAFEAISLSVTDLVSGNYMGQRFNPDAFGVNPFDVNIESVLNQARKYHNLPKSIGNEYADKVFEKVMDPAISKLLGMMKYLVAMPGMPTLFDGDDYGASGYETKAKNIYVKSRQKRHEEWIDDKNSKYKAFIDKHKKEFDEVMSVRRNPKCNALNNGAPFVLPLQCAYTSGSDRSNEGNIQVPALFRSAADGRMAISIFNPIKQHNDPSKYGKYDYCEYYSPEHLQLREIRLNYGQGPGLMEGDLGVGIVGLKPGTVFYNANNPKDTYRVNRSDDGKYYLKRENNEWIDLNDSTLILYSAPDNKPLSFTGSYNVKPSYRYVTSTYSKTAKNTACGEKLLLTR